MRFLIVLIISCIYLLDSVNSKSKYYDGPDRAYKFGYAIEGNQHRQEQKDENGIIMGEFGFITADGVYHVTGYGTDENGNFKILYMKNIKIGLPGEPGQEPAPKNLGGGLPQSSVASPVQPSRPLPPSSPQKSTAPAKVNTIADRKSPKPSDITSCGSCIIPEIEKEVNEVVQQKVTSSGNSIAQAPRAPGIGGKIGSTSGGIPGSSGQSLGPGGSRAGAQGRQGKALGFGTPSSASGPSAIDARQSSSQNGSPLSPGPGTSLQPPILSGTLTPSGSGSPGSRPSGLRPGSGSISTLPGSSSPSSVGNQNSLSRDPNGNSIASNKPGGLSPLTGDGSPSKIPVDLSKMQEIINGILYKFNYTVGYHGHHEKGDHIGNKDGGYFSVSRDGYHRTVDYTANENGFQPYIKLRQAENNEIPRPETEKEAGLKGYEFKWYNLGDDKKQ